MNKQINKQLNKWIINDKFIDKLIITRRAAGTGIKSL